VKGTKGKTPLGSAQFVKVPKSRRVVQNKNIGAKR
jgi:hypothetical protein